MNGGKKQSAQDRKVQILTDFLSWIEMREVEDDWEKYIYKTGDKLNRSEIANELCFARSAWTSNKELQSNLFELEDRLREEGKLRPPKDKDAKSFKAESARKDRSIGQSQSRIKALEQQNAALIAERDDLRRRVNRLEFLEHHMTTNGRVPH